MALSILLLLGLSIAGSFLLSEGSCRHLYYLVVNGGLEAAITVARLFYICQPFAIMSIAQGRTSVAILILSIMGLSVWRKRFLWFSIVSTLLICVLNSILLFTACSPVEAVWNPIIPATCWRLEIMVNMTIFTSSWNVFMDVCLALLPISIFWNLQMSLKKRVGLGFLMGGGILAAISGAMKTSKLHESVSNDVTWKTFDLLIWNGAETILIVVCGCVPTLKPVYDMCLGRRSRSSAPRPNYEHMRKLNSYPSSSGSRNVLQRLKSAERSSADPNDIRLAYPIDMDLWFKNDSHRVTSLNDICSQCQQHDGHIPMGQQDSWQIDEKRDIYERRHGLGSA